MSNSKILILGHARHGKDTVSHIIKDYTGLKFVSSSLVALDVIYSRLNEELGGVYKSKQEAFDDRVNHRSIWFRLISDYNTPDKSSLAKKILEQSDLYVGMRCNIEYEASKHLFNHIIWVDALLRVTRLEPTMMIPYNRFEMYYIHNNNTEDYLRSEVFLLLRNLNLV